MYYLQSRYYDPVVGRFVNGDSAEFSVIQQGAVEHNLFAYCGNEPVNEEDFFGYASISLTSIKSNTFAQWARKIKKLWYDGDEKRLINVSRGSFTLYLSISCATTLNKLKFVNFSKNSITISGRGFATTLGSKKLTYTVSRTIGGIEISTCAFVGTRGYGMGLSFIRSVYNSKNKKIGYVSLNLVGEVTYLTLAAVAVTVAGVCVVLPAVAPIASQLVKTFGILSSPSKVASLAYTFYTLATRLSNCFI